MSSDMQTSSFKPHFVIVGVVLVVLLALFFWPSSEEPPEEVVLEPVVETEPEAIPEPEPEPEIFEPAREIEEVEISPDAPIEPIPEVVYEPEPEPLDISDKAIEKALVGIANSDVITDFLVNEALLQRFVVTVTNVADGDIAPNDNIIVPPNQPFRIYKQADREWIDPASYKRYTPYVNAMESLDNERLIELFKRYETEIADTYEEIATSNDSFNEVLIDAINTLLDTPEVPMPVEVFTDSVVYKYKDERLENLSKPQKQLLRTGPDNMRRIKAKLRELKALIQ